MLTKQHGPVDNVLTLRAVHSRISRQLSDIAPPIVPIVAADEADVIAEFAGEQLPDYTKNTLYIEWFDNTPKLVWVVEQRVLGVLVGKITLDALTGEIYKEESTHAGRSIRIPVTLPHEVSQAAIEKTVFHPMPDAWVYSTASGNPVRGSWWVTNTTYHGQYSDSGSQLRYLDYHKHLISDYVDQFSTVQGSPPDPQYQM